jgi:hypothetical protein
MNRDITLYVRAAKPDRWSVKWETSKNENGSPLLDSRKRKLRTVQFKVKVSIPDEMFDPPAIVAAIELQGQPVYIKAAPAPFTDAELVSAPDAEPADAPAEEA